MSRDFDENIGQSSAGAAVEHPPVSLYAKKQMPHELGIRIHKSFPDKLYAILSDPKWQHIISFKEDGRSWQVRDKQLLEKEVLPHYFRSGKYFSFTRKVLIWGFRRSGKATYYHELFCRDRRDLVVQMTSVSKSRDIVEIPRTLPHCTKVKRTRKKTRNKEARDHNSCNKLSTNSLHLAGPVVRSGSVESADFAQGEGVDNGVGVAHNSCKNLSTNSLHLEGPVKRSGSVESADFAQGSDTAIAQQLLLLKQVLLFPKIIQHRIIR